MSALGSLAQLESIESRLLLSFASLSSAAVAELPPTRFATGSAIASCLRQIGAVLGISMLIALLGTGQSLHTFHHAYALMAIPSAAAGLLWWRFSRG